MSRVIKFRAWDRKANVMFDSSVDVRSEYDEAWGDTRAMNLGFIEEMAKDERYDVMQFTGLHDKNGKEIYEGDVVSYVSERFGKEYKHRPYKIEWTEILGEQGMYGYGFAMDDGKNYEVIGNIYENPELLKSRV